jgi:hypothetical protein
MMTIAEIQRAIEELPEDAQTRLAVWIAERERAMWDAEIERDFSDGGAGSALLETVRQQVRSGKSRPYAEGPPRR